MNMEDCLNLTLGLPGRDEESDKEESSCFKNNRNNNNNNNNNKRSQPDDRSESKGSSQVKEGHDMDTTHAAKSQVVGWPPVRRNYFQQKRSESEGKYVKVSMDGAPYLRKIDLTVYDGYAQLLKALENMFKLTTGYKGSEYAPTYQDKDGDWMLVGDVPWEMFTVSCKRMRIMKGSEAKGL